MSDLLNVATYNTLTNQSVASSSYLSAVFAAVQQQIARFLGYEPTLQVHTGEEGPVYYLGSGNYAGRYMLQLQHRPLVPGTAAQIFTNLELHYAAASVPASAVNLAYVEVDHATGRVYALASGAIDALVGTGFQVGATPGLRATSYVASYWAGASTGISDPTPPVGVTPPAIAPDITLAACLLVQEYLSYQAAQAAQSSASSASVPPGMVLAGRTVGERAEVYRPLSSSSSTASTLGLGSSLSVTAENLLRPCRKAPLPVLV